jgi:hypothetical protein
MNIIKQHLNNRVGLNFSVFPSIMFRYDIDKAECRCLKEVGSDLGDERFFTYSKKNFCKTLTFTGAMRKNVVVLKFIIRKRNTYSLNKNLS